MIKTVWIVIQQTAFCILTTFDLRFIFQNNTEFNCIQLTYYNLYFLTCDNESYCESIKDYSTYTKIINP